MADQLLARHGVVTRDVTAIEQLPGGFSALYPVLRRLEETGRIRRGYFVAGLGAAQFAQPGAVDLLRDMRDGRDEIVTVTLSATDPANPYGVLIPWPLRLGDDARGPPHLAQGRPREPPARASSSSMAAPRRGSAAAIGSWSSRCRMTSRSDRASAAPWRANWWRSRSAHPRADVAG